MTELDENGNTIVRLLREKRRRLAAYSIFIAILIGSGVGIAEGSAQELAGSAFSAVLPSSNEGSAARTFQHDTNNAGGTIAQSIDVGGEGNQVQINVGNSNGAGITPSPTVAAATQVSPTAPALDHSSSSVAEPASTSSCGMTDPPNHSQVPGAFTMQGLCTSYPSGHFFMIVRNQHANVDTGGAGPWWIQCANQFHVSGEFACSGFICVPGEDYEIALVFPHQGSFQAYQDWIDNHSTESKYDLPGDYDLVGSSLILRAAPTDGTLPAQCGRPLAAIGN